VAADGLEALSVRAVAARVGAAPMALYNHFPTKDALLVALLDRVIGRVAAGPPTGDWVADLRRLATAHRRVLAEHPWAVMPLFSHAAPGPNATRFGEEMFAVLRRGGITGEAAVAAFSGIIALNYGWAAFTTARPAQDTLAADLAALPPDLFPRTRELAGPLAGYGSERHYELALDSVVAGLARG
jgi:AcrR family transcriptional regulator